MDVLRNAIKTNEQWKIDPGVQELINRRSIRAVNLKYWQIQNKSPEPLRKNVAKDNHLSSILLLFIAGRVALKSLMKKEEEKLHKTSNYEKNTKVLDTLVQ